MERAHREQDHRQVRLVDAHAGRLDEVGAEGAQVPGDVVLGAALDALQAERAVGVLAHRAHELVRRAGRTPLVSVVAIP